MTLSNLQLWLHHWSREKSAAQRQRLKETSWWPKGTQVIRIFESFFQNVFHIIFLIYAPVGRTPSWFFFSFSFLIIHPSWFWSTTGCKFPSPHCHILSERHDYQTRLWLVAQWGPSKKRTYIAWAFDIHISPNISIMKTNLIQLLNL